MKDLTNLRFGRLTVIKCTGSKSVAANHSRRYWLCKCDCGAMVEIDTTRLKSGNTQSCGCLQREIVSLLNVKHQMSSSPEFLIWAAMLQRCTNPNNRRYKDYGGRGIVVCSRWREFRAFLADMGKRPSSLHSIDRINNDGNYELENCRWATLKEQANNSRHNHLLRFGGRTLNISQWAAKIGIPADTLRWRIRAGWETRAALTHPVRSQP